MSTPIEVGHVPAEATQVYPRTEADVTAAEKTAAIPQEKFDQYSPKDMSNVTTAKQVGVKVMHVVESATSGRSYHYPHSQARRAAQRKRVGLPPVDDF